MKQMKYSFKYNSNTSFKIVESPDSAGYSIKELKDIYKTHLETELDQVYTMTDEEFVKYFGVRNEF